MPKTLILLINAIVASAVIGTGCTSVPVVDGVAIIDATLIDARHGARAAQTVVVRDDQIVYVGSSERAPAAAVTIDGRGRFLIPGLWDMHVHLTYDDRFTASMPAAFLRYGVTSVRDTGGPLDQLLPAVAAMRDGPAPAPRVFFSGPLLDGERIVYGGGDYPPLGVANATVEAAVARVKDLHRQGVDFVKVYEMVSPPVFDAITRTARELNLPVAAHVPLSMRASEIADRVDSLEHLRNIVLDCTPNARALQQVRQKRLQEEQTLNGFKLRTSIHREQRAPAIDTLDEARCADVMTALRRVIQVPTARLNTFNRYPVIARDDWSEALALAPPAVQAEWAKRPTWFKPDIDDRDLTFAQFNLAMLRRMIDAGVPIGAGTDTPILYALPGHSLHHELEILVAAGLTPRDALGAATLRPAEFFGLENQMGAIETGQRADLVLLGANPLDDIRHTRSIEVVIARGQVVHRAR